MRNTDFWEQGRRHLEEYYKEHGTSVVPMKYVCADGFSLGSWVVTQRNRHKRGMLTKAQQDTLNKYDFVWDWREQRWEIGCRHLQAYVEEHGDARVPKKYVSDDGFLLGVWVRRQRGRLRKDQWNQRQLTKKQVRQLDKLGMIWGADDEGGRED